MKSSRKAPLRPPRLPPDLLPGNVRALEDEGEYAAAVLADSDFSRQTARSVAFDQVVLRHVSLGRARLPNMRMSDVRLEASDLSGASVQKARWHRVEFIGCRLTGMQLSQFSGGDLLFKECTLESALFTSGRFRSVHFERCNMRRVLLEKIDLAGAAFLGCDLTGADLTGSTLKGADFRGSDLTGVRVEGRQLQGITIDAFQAIQVAALLGIIVKDPGDQ
jgi:uncharacterized protein YjbI with pentapeptide repeats